MGPLRRSARMRLVLSFFLLLLVGCAAALVAVRGILLAELVTRVEIALNQEIDDFNRLHDSVDSDGESRGGSDGQIEVDDDLGVLFDTFLALDPPPEREQTITLIDGRVYRSAGAEGTGYDLASDPALVRRWGLAEDRVTDSVETPKGEVRYTVQPVSIDGQRGHFVVGVFIAQDVREIEAALRTAALVVFTFLVLGTFFTFVVAGKVFAPLNRLTETAHRITSRGLSQRIDVSGHDEFAELGRTFNDMLNRLDQAFATQRHLLRDVGHELRTPLAIASGHLEFVPETTTNREALLVVRAEHARMRRLIDDLLVLARADRRDFLQLETVDLAALTAELFKKTHHLANRDWLLENDRAGKVVADPDRLTQAMGNLIDNAVKKTNDGDTITIGARCERGLAALWVTDSGPGVREHERDRIFGYFERGRGEHPSSGTGLGLAICRRIAEAHSGTIAIDPTHEHGARFVITIPIDQPDSLEEP